MSRSLRRIVMVSGHPQAAPNLDDLLVETNDYDVIFVESIACGYSRIKQVTPDLVIVLLEIDDFGACQLLSMLKVDRDVSRIPVVTCATRPNESELEDEITELEQYSPGWSLALPMN
jgi:DNA-binding NarL/FixJ family response regulator